MNRPHSLHPFRTTKKAFRQLLTGLVFTGGMFLVAACAEPVAIMLPPPNPPATPNIPDTPDAPNRTFNFIFATPEEGAAHLGVSDTFTQGMSPLERNLRVGQAGVSENELLEYTANQTLAWTPAETQRLSGVAQTLSESLKGLQYALPD